MDVGTKMRWFSVGRITRDRHSRFGGGDAKSTQDVLLRWEAELNGVVSPLPPPALSSSFLNEWGSSHL